MLNSLFNTKYVLGRNRNPWVDYARGICIILVCYRHTYEGLVNSGLLQPAEHGILQYLNVYFFSFRMPLFFIVSGIFVGMSLAKKGVGNYIEDRLRYIFYPLVIWGSIQITLQLFMANYANATREPIDYLYLIIAPREIEQFWYLNALFFVGVLYVILKVKLKFTAYQQLILGSALYLIAAICLDEKINLGLFVDIFFFYPFFAIGDCISHLVMDPEKRSKLLSLKSFLFILPLFLIGQYVFTNLNLKHNDDYYVHHSLPALFALIAIIGCAFIVNVCYFMERANSVRFLRVIGYHSLYIYIMHLIIIAGLRAVYTKVFGLTNVYLFILLAISLGILLPIVTYNLANRIGAGWIFELKKNRSKKQISDLPQGYIPKVNNANPETVIAD